MNARHLRPSGGFYALPVHQQHQLRAGVEHVASLGNRAVCELLVEVGQDGGDLPAILARLDRWRGGIAAEMVHAAGGDRFAHRPLHEVMR